MRMIYRFLLLITSGLLAVIGLAGCPFAVEYGAPHADYDLSGTVKNRANQPIEGIKLFMVFRDADSDDYDHVFSGDDGSWHIKTSNGPPDWGDVPGSVYIKAVDVDGTSFGLYREETLLVEPDQTESGDSKWDYGTYAKHDIALVLDEDSNSD